MDTVTSADGTVIAYEKKGHGPALIHVDGALCAREQGPARAFMDALSSDFTVYIYDRRGRGDSGNQEPYAPEREYEDLEAVVTAAGGGAYVFGESSGAVLAADTAARGAGIERLALYEAPFIVDGTRKPRPDDFLATMDALVADGKNGAAVGMFMKSVGVPAPVVGLMRLMPVWGKLKALAPTLPNDLRVLGDTQSGRPLPPGRWAGIQVPTLVMAGGKSPEYMRNSATALAGAVPGAKHEIVPGQTHLLKATAVAPFLKEFR